MKKVKPNKQFRAWVDLIGSQADAARVLGVSQGFVSLLYNGKRRVGVDLAQRIHLMTCGQVSRESLMFQD